MSSDPVLPWLALVCLALLVWTIVRTSRLGVRGMRRSQRAIALRRRRWLMRFWDRLP